MALILSNQMLERMLCSVCEAYLSALPVKVYKNGVIKCGRCCSENDGGSVSLYQTVMTYCLFKCINRYEGCNVLLKPSEVLKHEKTCNTGNYICPKCEISLSGYKLIQHYQRDHPQSILRKNMIFVTVKKHIKERYLYVIADKVFFVLVENFPYETLYLSAVSLRCHKDITQQFSVKLIGKTSGSFTTTARPCVSMQDFKCDYFKICTNKTGLNQVNCQLSLDLSQDASVVTQISTSSEESTDSEILMRRITTKSNSTQTIPIEDVPTVKFTDEFELEYPNYKLTPCGTALFTNGGKRIELTCSNCRRFTGCNVFNCKFSKHIVCWDCNAWCGICDSQIEGWSAEISSINELLLLPCVCKCGRNFAGGTLRNHEYEFLRKYCPVQGCLFESTIPTLEKHLTDIHKNSDQVTNFNLTNFLRRSQSAKLVYFLQKTFWFKMLWNKVRIFDEVYEITVVPCAKYMDTRWG